MSVWRSWWTKVVVGTRQWARSVMAAELPPAAKRMKHDAESEEEPTAAVMV